MVKVNNRKKKIAEEGGFVKRKLREQTKKGDNFGGAD